ncbi:type VII secretion integral membrane protein EccD [Nocardioides dongxiaopingii]|uniref:type VII secretion integral membrane protein EccD n=1 Tax=Nocardioides TaxID=1839 RepID=UPI0010C766D0|nr:MULTISPECIES: type VII secretion integral membrane protein EccD [Nocardioides]QDH10615.1 type VII secretion integral membrane protein EccD [Nocardioides sp. S-1144]
MSQASVSASGLVRVTVSSGTRRVDLVLPGAVPVAELVPELARSVGLLDSATVYGGYRLVTSEGRRLEGDSGLTLQGIDDGSVISVTAGIDEPDPPVYDDVVEAMTDVVEHELKPWAPAAGRRTALAAAAMFMALGAATLFIQGTELSAYATAIVAGALVAGAIVLSRAQGEPEASVTVAWIGVGYAAVAALMFAADEGDLLGSSGTWSERAEQLVGVGGIWVGTACAAVGVVCLIGLGPGRTLLTPAVVVGAVLAVSGVVVDGTSIEPGVLLVCILTFVVLVGSIFPWLALGVTGTTVDQLYSAADITADPDDIDPARVAADARVAHEILVAISATVGILLVLVAPLAVDRGLLGTLLATMACLVVMFRTRQYRTGSEVLVGLASGIAGLVTVAASTLARWPDWHPTVAVVLAGAGALLLALTLLPAGPSVRRGRFGDLVETISLLALLPLLVLAIDVSIGF